MIRIHVKVFRSIVVIIVWKLLRLIKLIFYRYSIACFLLLENIAHRWYFWSYHANWLYRTLNRLLSFVLSYLFETLKQFLHLLVGGAIAGLGQSTSLNRFLLIIKAIDFILLLIGNVHQLFGRARIVQLLLIWLDFLSRVIFEAWRRLFLSNCCCCRDLIVCFIEEVALYVRLSRFGKERGDVQVVTDGGRLGSSKFRIENLFRL